MAFRIGQKVVLVDDARLPRHGPVKGRVYTVGATKAKFIELGEIPNCSWFSSRFRPVVERKTDISAFKEILDRENHGLPSRVDYPADCEPK